MTVLMTWVRSERVPELANQQRGEIGDPVDRGEHAMTALLRSETAKAVEFHRSTED